MKTVHGEYLFRDEIESIYEFDSLTGKRTAELKDIVIYPANHYVTPRPAISQAIVNIKKELGRATGRIYRSKQTSGSAKA